MEDISRLVNDSFIRNGVQPAVDHLRLEWSRWFRCESSFSVLLAPSKAGIFALGEEIVPPAELALRGPSTIGSDVAAGKRMLALFQITETDDLGMALGRMFLPGNPLREKLSEGRCFARYTVIEDAAQRSAAYKALSSWMQDSADITSGVVSKAEVVQMDRREEVAALHSPMPLPSGF
jgi:hypothetical protein